MLDRLVERSSPETWAMTLPKTLTMMGRGAHELSKLQVRVARWSGDTIGPTIIAAPHRGQAHVAGADGVSVDVGAIVVIADADGGGVARTVRAKAMRAPRHVLARNPD